MPFADINGARLYYEERGSGRPILLHHGWTASRAHWMPVAERLEDRYRVILMECRGTGESEHTADGYSFRQYAADVVAMADHLGLERFTYAGHSMGGGIGYTLALEHAERLDGLVLMAAVPADGVPNWDRDRLATMRQIRATGDRAALMREHVAARFRPDVQTDAWFNLRIDCVLGCSDGHYFDSIEAMEGLRVGDRLGEIGVPTLVIAGALDALLRANLADYLRLPHATLQVFSFAGHEVAVHEPDGVAEAIERFLEHGALTSESLASWRRRGD